MKSKQTDSPALIRVGNVKYVRKDILKREALPKPNGPDVIVRTFSAGVHIGEMVSRSGTEVTLRNARRLWCWAGAFTLNEASRRGINRAKSRISCAVPEILLLQAVEILPVAEGIDLSATEEEESPGT